MSAFVLSRSHDTHSAAWEVSWNVETEGGKLQHQYAATSWTRAGDSAMFGRLLCHFLIDCLPDRALREAATNLSENLEFHLTEPKPKLLPMIKEIKGTLATARTRPAFVLEE